MSEIISKIEKYKKQIKDMEESNYYVRRWNGLHKKLEEVNSEIAEKTQELGKVNDEIMQKSSKVANPESQEQLEALKKIRDALSSKAQAEKELKVLDKNPLLRAVEEMGISNALIKAYGLIGKKDLENFC